MSLSSCWRSRSLTSTILVSPICLTATCAPTLSIPSTDISTSHHHETTSTSTSTPLPAATPPSRPSSPPPPSPSSPPPSHPHLHIRSDSGHLSHTHRMMSAAVGSLITSLVVTPLDVIKTRLQAQIPSRSSTPSPSPSASTLASSARTVCHHAPSLSMMDVWYETCYSPASTHLPPWTPWATSRVRPALVLCTECDASHAHSTTTTSTRPSTSTLRFTSSTDALIKLIRYEGATSLWRGLSPTLIMSIPSTVIYFSVYDWLKDELLTWHYGSGNNGVYDDRFASYVPMIAGIAARSMTTTLVAPIELVRTKAQAHDKHVSMMTLIRSELSKSHSYANLWRGVSPTLLRDVPFSGIYWSSYEWCKAYLMTRHPLFHDAQHEKQTLVWSSFISGAFGGMLSATITHPFDLVKTRRQIELYSAATNRPHIPESTVHILRTIVREEGWIGLTNGLAARLVKVTPACAIMISSYEIAKTYFARAPT